MNPIILSLFGGHPVAHIIAEQLSIEQARIIHRDFPDGETYLKFESELKNKDLIIVDSLDRPNGKLLPLLFAAKTAKELGANSIGLCAPYLAYMRQDKRFKPGEGITSNYFSALLSEYFDWLVTVDPHLHRYHDLSELYTIPNKVLHAASKISEWIQKEINSPVLIGPDSESEQWVSEVANEAGAPYIILEKTRHGDKDVEITLPNISPYLNHTPVLVDDIISTAHTMIETISHLHKVEMKPPVCIGVHAVFAENAYEALLQQAEKVVTCNTIKHISNQIDLSAMLKDGILQQLGGY